MAKSWDAKRGGKAPHFHYTKISLKVAFCEHNVSVIWNSLTTHWKLVIVERCDGDQDGIVPCAISGLSLFA